MPGSPSPAGAPASPSTPTKKGKSATLKTPSKLRQTANTAKEKTSSPIPRKSPPKLKSFSKSEEEANPSASSRPKASEKAPSTKQELGDPEPEISETESDVPAPQVGDDVSQSELESVNGTAEDAADGSPVDLSALKGLEVSDGGHILGKDGKVLGRVVEGNPDDLIGQVVGVDGDILDEDGDAIGRVEAVPEATQQKEQDLGEAGDTASGANDALQINLRGLEGLEVGEGGEIKNDSGEVLARIVEGDPEDLVGYPLNNRGEVVDEDGDAIGRAEIVPQTGGHMDAGQVDSAADVASPEQQVNGDSKQKPTNSIPNTARDIAPKPPASQDRDKAQDIPNVSNIAGLTVDEQGEVVDNNGNVLAKLQDGKLEEAVGNEVNDRGLVLDDDGNIMGKIARIDDPGEETNAASHHLPPLSILEGLKCNKQGKIVDANGKPIGELAEGNAKALWKFGAQLDDQGQFWDNKGNVIGRARTIEIDDEEDSPFTGLESLIVVKDGWIEDENENRVGRIVQGDAKKLLGRAVDEDGDIIDKRGNVVGHAERYEGPEIEETTDLTAIKGLVPNKQGNVMGPDGVPIARVIDGNPKNLAGRKIDGEGRIWDDSGKVVGQCELIPETERESKAEGPFAGLEGLVVVKDGLVEDEKGNTVGKVEEGDPKQLRGQAVDEDGDIIDKYGNVKGRVVPYELPEEEALEEDLSPLSGKAINKAGNIVDEHGVAIGRIVSGDPKKLAGRKADNNGQIWGDSGKVIGKVELIPDADRERSEGPFSAFDDLTVGKDGLVQDNSGQVVGRIIDGDATNLRGRKVDEDGEILDKSGNILGKAEPWEPEERQRDITPMAGRKVTKEGEVRDADGNLIGKLTEGNLKTLIGKSIDDNGYVVDNNGNKIGECTLLDNMPDEHEEPQVSEEQVEADRKAEQDRDLAKKMSSIVQQTLDKIGAVCKMIKEHTERADRTPKDELDEERLVQEVRPLIEEGNGLLQECNGALRALDPDGQIAAKAKSRSAQRDASPEEHQLADLLKELTETVVTTIDSARKRIANMPHAKKELNPLWGLLSEPLFQIITAVGLLLTGVLGLVGRLLNGLGLGGLVNNLLGGLGINKVLGELGLGSLTEALGLGGKKKK
ncbi:hypothetical protein FQN50_003139 [Emmonsiellopsis sp. PD_5]|nr:hypothetical protein FQN50_003139 [Emmonsiellopsis sp. PD_5]